MRSEKIASHHGRGSGGEPGGICIIGSRGVPASYGGFETFAEHLARFLAKRGVPVCVVGEPVSEASSVDSSSLEGVEIRHTRNKKGRNPLLYYIESAFKAPRSCGAILCLGPGGIFAWPVCLIRGTKLVLNLDGLNSRRQKWSWLKRKLFRALEVTAALLPIDKVLDSRALTTEFSVPSWGAERIHVIEYGSVDIAASGNREDDRARLRELGLELGRYFLVVARLEPENSIETIISAHRRSETHKPLVVVGNWGSAELEERVKADAAESCMFLGAIHDQSELHALRRSAAAYLHGHQVGGTNPSLVEAMAADNQIIAHDNPFNRTTLEGCEAQYFSSVADLGEILREHDSERKPLTSNGRSCYEVYQERYTWSDICTRYGRMLGCDMASTEKGSG